MTEIFLQLLIGLFAVYGFIQLAINIFNGIKLRNQRDDGIKLILTFKNRQDKVEGAVRNIFLNGVLDRIGADNTLYVADMGSTDDTPKIIHNLCDQYINLKTVNVKENEVLVQ
ncbi:MAG: hypothetical protein PHV32_02930 [Eubacteriales bacterium]|nr:hypothetical protein [Eubacteriales bacterium]